VPDHVGTYLIGAGLPYLLRALKGKNSLQHSKDRNISKNRSESLVRSCLYLAGITSITYIALSLGSRLVRSEYGWSFNSVFITILLIIPS